MDAQKKCDGAIFFAQQCTYIFSWQSFACFGLSLRVVYTVVINKCKITNCICVLLQFVRSGGYHTFPDVPHHCSHGLLWHRRQRRVTEHCLNFETQRAARDCISRNITLQNKAFYSQPSFGSSRTRNNTSSTYEKVDVFHVCCSVSLIARVSPYFLQHNVTTNASGGQITQTIRREMVSIPRTAGA